MVENHVDAFLTAIASRSTQTKENYALSLKMFGTYLNSKHGLDNESVLTAIKKRKLSVYQVLAGFAGYLSEKNSLAPQSIKTRLAGAKSYLQYNDVDIIPAKFKHQVKLPRVETEDQQSVDASDIRSLIVSCSNRRLRALLLVLASGGMRAGEALAMRIRDIDLNTNPPKLHIRKEYAKTRKARDVFISIEAAQEVQKWLTWKYSESRANPQKQGPDDLIFANYNLKNPAKSPKGIYVKILIEFEKLLETVGKGERKEGMLRHKITMHSLRRFAKTVIWDQAGQDYSEWFLGHRKSTYWQKKPEERAEIYRSKCMRLLTFLNFAGLEKANALWEENTRLKQEVYELDEANRILTKQALQHKPDLDEHEQRVLDQIPDMLKEIRTLRAELEKVKKKG
jgi:integrase